jgi:hypothetical protein
MGVPVHIKLPGGMPIWPNELIAMAFRLGAGSGEAVLDHHPEW